MLNQLTRIGKHRMTLRRRIISLSKQLWLVALFVAVLLYIVANFNDVWQQLSRYTLQQVVLTMVLAAFGRLLLFNQARIAAEVAGFQHSYLRFFRVLALAQLARYIPGGIWHFVGQGAFYRNNGMPLMRAGRALLLENLWLLQSAALTAGALLILANASASGWVLVLWPLIWLALNALLARVLFAPMHWYEVLRVSVLQVLMWLLFSLSFAVLLPQFDVTLTTGAFIGAWVVGFVTVFAPGGLGTREGALVVLLLPVLPAQEALNVALLHRFLWILTEVLLGLAAVGLRYLQDHKAQAAA